MDDVKLQEILLAEHYIAEEDIAALPKGARLADFLISRGIITKQLLGQAIAEHFGVKYLDLSRAKFDDTIFSKIPEVVAKAQQVVAVSRLKRGIKVGCANPDDIALLSLLEKRFGETIIPYFSLESDIEEALTRYQANIQAAFDVFVTQYQDPQTDEIVREQLISQIVDLILDGGHRNKASDIHMEPHHKEIVVRYRIDGVLQDILTVGQDLYEPMLSRIKILSKMRTDQHRAAQDGKFRFKTADSGRNVDVRVSVVPTNKSENVVMRLLSSESRQYGLQDLGFEDKDLARVKSAITNPHGMILVTGPTGSGKTTTLYAMLKLLNTRDVHVATIEDPVEYDMEGVTQIQVNAKTNLTFANGLRALVRQDPDIIMVGEVRDEETAGIAINSALTGHLVLSTLHTNDAATALPRFLDMKIEPFLVASTVNVIVAQRLVRKVCRECVVSYAPSEKEIGMMTQTDAQKDALTKAGYTDLTSLRLYKGSGCKVCGDTGYVGRLGIFEVLIVSDEIRKLIMNNANAENITAQAIQEGMTTMTQDGLMKAIEGKTTLDEVFRVAI